MQAVTAVHQAGSRQQHLDEDQRRGDGAGGAAGEGRRGRESLPPGNSQSEASIRVT